MATTLKYVVHRLMTVANSRRLEDTHGVHHVAAVCGCAGGRPSRFTGAARRRLTRAGRGSWWLMCRRQVCFHATDMPQ